MTIVVVGDSFSAPPNAADAAAGYRAWPTLLGERLGMPVVNRAVPGAGYVATGILGPHARRRFSQQLLVGPHPDPRLVIVFGSPNDRPAHPPEVCLTAWATLRAAQQQYPNARHLWIGPVWSGPNPIPADTWRVRDDVLQAVWGLPFQRWADPLVEGWLPPNRPDLWGPDQFHANAAGQRHLADRIEPHARAVLA